METKGNTALKRKERFTYGQLRTWPEGERWELIEGEAFCMSPAPSRRYQRLVVDLISQLRFKLEGTPCEPYVSPIDVFLVPDGWNREADDAGALDTVVQPDIVVVCDSKKLIDEGILGAPDFILEVLSPSTAYRDLTAKRDLYEKRRVREYWIVNPETLEVHIYLLTGASYGIPRSADLAGGVAATVLGGISLTARR